MAGLIAYAGVCLAHVAVQEELCLTSTARRMSVAPPRRHSNVNARNSSGRQGSMFWGRPTIFEGICSFLSFSITFSYEVLVPLVSTSVSLSLS